MFQISQNQAQEIAILISSDIKSYVNEHRAEYERFLANEQKRNNNKIRDKKVQNAKFY